VVREPFMTLCIGEAGAKAPLRTPADGH